VEIKRRRQFKAAMSSFVETEVIQGNTGCGHPLNGRAVGAQNEEQKEKCIRSPLAESHVDVMVRDTYLEFTYEALQNADDKLLLLQ
jgi:hypothetical protein